MKMSILFKDLQAAGTLRQRIEDRLRLVLTRFTPLIRGLTVTVADENGVRGGIDKSCRLIVRLHAGTVVVNEQAAAVMGAVTLAAERAARSIARIHHRAVDARQAVPGAWRRRRVAPSASDRRESPDSAARATS